MNYDCVCGCPASNAQRVRKRANLQRKTVAARGHRWVRLAALGARVEKLWVQTRKTAAAHGVRSGSARERL
eukprot:3004346-Lingulodinium_polyedra.AAC.1